MRGRATEPESLTEVASTVGEFEANILAALLKNEGIEAHVFRSVGSMLGCGPIVTKDVVRVMVRAADVEAARAALERSREESVDIDWSEVDVGVRVDEPARPVEAEAASRGLLWLGVAMAIVAAGVLAVSATL